MVARPEPPLAASVAARTSTGLGAMELETEKEPLPQVLEPKLSEPACRRPVVCPLPSWGRRSAPALTAETAMEWRT